VKESLFQSKTMYLEGCIGARRIDCVRYARRVGRPLRDSETGLGLGIVTTPR